MCASDAAPTQIGEVWVSGAQRGSVARGNPGKPGPVQCFRIPSFPSPAVTRVLLTLISVAFSSSDSCRKFVAYPSPFRYAFSASHKDAGLSCRCTPFEEPTLLPLKPPNDIRLSPPSSTLSASIARFNFRMTVVEINAPGAGFVLDCRTTTHP